MKTQKITTSLPEGTARIETGNLQINDDWTGVFIRGDHAIMYTTALDRVILNMESNPHDPVLLFQMKSLKSLLSDCNENSPKNQGF